MKHPSTAVIPNSGRRYATNNTAQEILLKHLSYEPQDSVDRYPWKGKTERKHNEDPCDIHSRTMESPKSVHAFEQSWMQFQNCQGDPFDKVVPDDFVPATVSSKIIRKLQRKNTPRKNELIREPNETQPTTTVSERGAVYSKDMRTIYSPQLDTAPPMTPQRQEEHLAPIPTPPTPQKLTKAEGRFYTDDKTLDQTDIVLLATDFPSPDRTPSPLNHKRLRVSSRKKQSRNSTVAPAPSRGVIPLIKTRRLANPKYCGESLVDDSSTEDIIATIDSLSDESSCCSSHSFEEINPVIEKKSFMDQCDYFGWYEGVDCCQILFKEPNESFDENDAKSVHSLEDDIPHQKKVTFDDQAPYKIGPVCSMTSTEEPSQDTRWQLRIDNYDTTRFAEILRQLKGNTRLRELHVCRAPRPADRRRSVRELLSLFVALETLPSLERLYFQDFQSHELELIPLEELLDSNPSLSSLEIGTTKAES